MFCTECDTDLANCRCLNIWDRLHNLYGTPADPAGRANTQARIMRIANQTFGEAGWHEAGELEPDNNGPWFCYWCEQGGVKAVKNTDMAFVNMGGTVIAVPCCPKHYAANHGKLREKL